MSLQGEGRQLGAFDHIFHSLEHFPVSILEECHSFAHAEDASKGRGGEQTSAALHGIESQWMIIRTARGPMQNRF